MLESRAVVIPNIGHFLFAPNCSQARVRATHVQGFVLHKSIALKALGYVTPAEATSRS
jgi:hypothetical protein